jgi:hypothetical protein
MPGVISELRFTHLTFVITDDEEDQGRSCLPVNAKARLVHIAEKARTAPRTIAAFCHGSTRNPCAIATKAKAIATKAIVSVGDDVLCAIKASTVNAARRECVGILSTSNFEDSQGDNIDRDALRRATFDLAARVGTKAYVTDVNHRREIDDVKLAAVWPGTGGIGDDDATYCLWQFAPGSKTWEAVKAGRCAGFSFKAPIRYAAA